jgi:hypothetical protein
MARIDDAVAAIKLKEEGEQFLYRLIAKKFSVNRTTLA